MKNLLFSVYFIINIGFTMESGKCGNIADANKIYESSLGFRNYLQNHNHNTREIHWVPIQFHIVERDNGTGGLNEILLSSIINDLNTDYINANIRFFQYSSVDYILDSDYYNTDGDVEINQLKSINNTDNVIDIYAVGSLSSGDNALCGISSFTWYGIQGIIVANGCFDRSTVNHEVGHYFNLFHPHETADGTEFVNGNGCQYRGDGICDTPADPDLSLGGMVSACNYIGNVTDPNGQAYDDCQGYEPCEYYGGPDVGNIMSYSPDICVDHFTDEQYEKIEYVLTSIREEYIQTPNFVEFSIVNQIILDNEGDGDSIINPGEIIDLLFEIEIDEDWPVGAIDIIGTLSSNEDNIEILSDQNYTSGLVPGDSYVNQNDPFKISFSSNSVMKDYVFNLNLSYFTNNNQTNYIDLPILLNVSFNQYGFPYQTQSTVESSPVIVDIDNDGFNEIIFGDYSGKLNICEYDMQECNYFMTDGQIWSSPAIADIDNDGILEIVIASVDKYIYILNPLGELEYSYFTDQFLVGTPALGNIDTDSELEIIIGGYSNSGKLFAINHDGTSLLNYPITINEKIRKGVALADVDHDGMDEIFFGTESDNLYRIDSGGIIFNNNPLLIVGDKIKFAPIIVYSNDTFNIIIGSSDGNLYVINSVGEINFSFVVGDEIHGAAIIKLDDSFGIVFGSENGFIYVVDDSGEIMSGWPQYTGYSYESAPVISDLDLDGYPEIIFSSSAYLQYFNLDGNFFIPQINIGQTVKGNPVVSDLDLDGDLEVFSGTNFNLSAIDIKTSGNINNYWSIYRGNLSRTGYINVDQLYINYHRSTPKFNLLNPYPNPFNIALNLPIEIDAVGNYKIEIYNLRGQLIKASNYYFNQFGVNIIDLEFNNIASGSYFICAKNDKNISKIMPITLLK